MKKNNVYITSAVRTAVASIGKSLKNVPADDLGACVIENVLSKKIVEHQHYILKTYCETPSILGGVPL